MAKIIKTTGEVVEIAPKNGTDFQLEEVQQIVGGYVEAVNLQDGRLLLCDEDGRRKEKPVNLKATEEMINALGSMSFCALGWDYIVGDVLICNSNEIK